MNTVPAREIYKLDGAIVPQLFIERDGDIYFFDKINPHEGRFCRFQKGEVKVVLEVGEGQGIINHRGEIYLLQIGETTVISKYKLDGQMDRTISMDGIFFDFKINESGYFILLGYIDNETVIKILNSRGLDSGLIKPRKVLFGSCIGLHDDDIYLGGFDEKNVFTLTSMNYIGSIQNEWKIDVDSEDRIIGKIQRYEKFILLHIVGKYDSVVILDSESGDFKEIIPGDLGLSSFIDTNIYDGEIQILDEKNIYTWNLGDVLNISRKSRFKDKRDAFSPASYQYLMYLKGLEKELVRSLKISLISMSIVIGYLFYAKTLMDVPLVKIISLSIPCFWILNFTIASAKNFTSFMDKSKRIDELLGIYSSKRENYIILPIFTSLAAVSFHALFIYPDIRFLALFITGIVSIIFSILLKLKLVKVVKLQNKNVSIELLNFGESRFGEYVRAVVENLKGKGSESAFVSLTLKRNIDNEVVNRWIRSRKDILGISPNFIICGNIVRMEFDFSKRDIKYSRYSILMDYICYIEGDMDIEEIQIGSLEDEG